MYSLIKNIEFSGICPLSQKIQTISVEYLEVSTVESYRSKYCKGRFSGDTHCSKCTLDNDCPIYDAAPIEV